MNTAANVMEHIRDNYSGWKLSGWAMWRIAADCECAISTVYRAVNHLIAMKAVDENRIYSGRQFIPTAELINHLPPEYPFFYENHRDQLVKKLFTTPEALYFSVEWAIQSRGVKDFASGNTYGWMLEVNRNWSDAA